MTLSRRTLLLSCAAVWPDCVRAQATPGLGEREVLIGRSTPASSPFAEMARQRRTGADAWIARINAAGGVHGRRIRIIDRDDAYRADKAVSVADELLQREEVFALLGAFGTPTVPVIMAKAEAAGVPLVGASTLTNAPRDPVKRYVFPVRASALAEATHAVRHQRTLAVERFATLSSREAYGPAGAIAFADALQAAGMQPVASLAFAATDDPVAIAERLRASGAQTLLVSVLPKPFAAVLSHYRKLGGAAQVIGFSAIRIEDLVDALGPLATGVGLSQPMPVPSRVAVPLVKNYREALAALSVKEQPSYNGLEGFLEAQVLVEGLRRAGRAPTRERLVDGLESMKAHDFGGVMVKYGAGDRTGSTYIDIVMLGSRGAVVY